MSEDHGSRSLPVGEVARQLGVVRQTVRNWIKAGRIEAKQYPGGHYRVPEVEVERVKSG